MAESTGLIIAAAGLVVVNETVLKPAVSGQPLFQNVPWRIIPATVIAAVVCAGVESISEPVGKGLAGLVLLAVLLGTASSTSSPIENAAKLVGGSAK